MKPHEMRAEARKKLDEANAIFRAVEARGGNAEPSADEEKRHNDLVAEAEGLTAKATQIEARDKRINDLEAQLGQNPDAGTLPHNDRRNSRNGRHGYSVLKALRQADPSNKFDRLDGIEAETHAELQKRHARPSKGVLIPWDLPIDARLAAQYAERSGLPRGAERRDLTTSTGAGAVYEVVSTTMIELLRALMVTRALGARVLTGLNGNFSIPKQTGGGTGYWVTEGNAPTESGQTIGSVDFSPSTLGAFTDYSRAFLNQTAVDAEQFVREDLATVLAIELDRAGLNGSGSGAEPTGIIPDSNVNVVAIGTNGGAPTWAKIVEMEQVIDTANAMIAPLSFVTSPKGRGKLKQVTKVASSTFSDFLWESREATVNSYPAVSTTQIPTNLTKGTGTNLTAAILGAFNQLIFAMWGGLDVLVDPFTGGTAGNVRIIELQDCDVQIRQPKAFAVCKDLDPA